MYDAKSGCPEWVVDGIEASMVSGVQGMDPKKTFSAFYRISEGERMY